MTDTEIKQSLIDQYIKERVNQYDRFFSTPLWRKSLHPYLRALYEISIRKVLTEKDHVNSDMQKGFALAYENVINLPKFIEFLAKEKTNGTNQDGEDKLPGASTDYMGDFDDL